MPLIASVNYTILDALARIAELLPGENERENLLTALCQGNLTALLIDGTSGETTIIRSAAWNSRDGRFHMDWDTGIATANGLALDVPIDPYSTGPLREIKDNVVIERTALDALLGETMEDALTKSVSEELAPEPGSRRPETVAGWKEVYEAVERERMNLGDGATLKSAAARVAAHSKPKRSPAAFERRHRHYRQYLKRQNGKN